MYLAYMIKSDKPEKKYKVIVSDGNTLKTIYFGSSMYEDYTMHKNDIRKKLYSDRHKSKEDWNNPFTAGFWSRWILWNKKLFWHLLKTLKKDLKWKYIT